jgi:dynein heavy chain
MMREFFSSLHISPEDTVFDYQFDEKTLKFSHWKEKLAFEPFKYEKELPFFKLVVETVDTLRFSYLVDVLTKINKSVFLTGSTGTGKSMIV